jgi:pimeloyl-ACP methyl ester carboxylesterase
LGIAALAAGSVAGTACSDDSTTTPGTDGGTSEPFALEVSCDDTADSIYGDPGALPAEKGAVMKCTKDPNIAAADLQARADKNGYKGKPFTSGAKVYRVLFRTERGDAANTPGYSSAIVYVPDKPRAAQLPVVVASHGSRGQAAACAPSKNTPEGQFVQDDFERLVFPLVGAGYAVMAPDWAGYANYGKPGNPPSAYASAADVGKSNLDSIRAMRKLFGKSLTTKVVLAGHSQGGHGALAALALSSSYGVDGEIAALVTYSPLWFSQRTWGALLFLHDRFPIKTSGTPNAVSVWYHYTHGELLDGPGKGLEVFAESKRAGIKDFVDTQCWTDGYAKLEALGTTARDLYDPTFANAIATAASGIGDCNGNALCEKWMARYAEDRPRLTGNATKVPILYIYGNKDTAIPPDRSACGLQRLTTGDGANVKGDGANVTVCVEPNEEHTPVVDVRSSYASDWIAFKTLDGPDPGPCAVTQISDQNGALAKCATPPPND